MRMRVGIAVVVLVLLSRGSAVAQQCDTFQECMAGMCQNGQCVGVPLNSGSCDDFNPCTTNDSCMNGECHGTPTSGGSCDDSNECTLNDTCVDLGGESICMGSTPAEIGSPCASGCGVCQQLVPVPGVPPFCRPAEGKVGQPCTLQGQEDLGACFVGTCSAPGGQIGFCSPSFKLCPDDGNLCTGEYCNPESGNCETAPLPVRIDCFPAECHRCEPGTGQCVPNNVGASCDDFNTCTASTVCASDGQCVAGSPQQTATATATTIGNTPTPTPTVVFCPCTPTQTRTVTHNTATPTRTQGTPQPTATQGRCVGDCDHSGQVRVNELVIGVNIALDRAAFSTCSSFDINGNERVEVNELVSGVNSLVRGCVGAAAGVSGTR